MLSRMVRFFRFNQHKALSLRAAVHAAWFRFALLHGPPRSRGRLMRGVAGGESPREETDAHYQTAWRVHCVVETICEKTPWQSRCLVRALTAQRLLEKAKISSTLYLGCGKKEGELVAHAWLRCGNVFVTGGDGGGYAMLSSFAWPG